MQHFIKTSRWVSKWEEAIQREREGWKAEGERQIIRGGETRWKSTFWSVCVCVHACCIPHSSWNICSLCSCVRQCPVTMTLSAFFCHFRFACDVLRACFSVRNCEHLRASVNSASVGVRACPRGWPCQDVCALSALPFSIKQCLLLVPQFSGFLAWFCCIPLNCDWPHRIVCVFGNRNVPLLVPWRDVMVTEMIAVVKVFSLPSGFEVLVRSCVYKCSWFPFAYPSLNYVGWIFVFVVSLTSFKVIIPAFLQLF